MTAGAANLKIAAVLAVVAIAASLPVLGTRLVQLAGDFAAPGIGRYIANTDFVNYWMGPVLSLGGEVGVLFDPPAYEARLEAMFGPDYPPHMWSYPPHALLVLWPLGLLPYQAALVLFLSATLAVFLFAAEAFRRRFAPSAPATVMLAGLLPFVLVNLASTQNGFLTGALLLGALAVRGERPILAGLLLAILTTKPQLGILIPFFLAFDRQWQAIAWAAFFTLLLLALSLAAFGPDPWRAYVSVTMPSQHEVMSTWRGIMLVMMPTVMSGLRLLGAEAAVAQGWQAAFSLACLPAVLWLLWRNRASQGDPATSALILTAGTVLVAPYSFNYDMGALAGVAAAMFAREVSPGPGRPARASVVIACLVLFMLPTLTMQLGLLGLPVVPFLAAACLGLLAWPVKAARPAPA